MSRFIRASLFVVVVVLSLASASACGPPPVTNLDGGDGPPGGFLPPLRDGGLPPLVDAGPTGGDDGGAPLPDAGPPSDAGPTPDSGTAPDDAGPEDAGPGDAGVVVVLVSAEGGPCFEAAGAVCDDGLVCTPYYVSGAGTCARPCTVEGQACAGGGACNDFGPAAEPFLACATEAAEGEGCDPERLITCGGDGVCLTDDESPLGGTCRTTCTCQTGSSCSTGACPTSTCVVIDLSAGAGYCGVPAQPGEPCDPTGAGVFCEGNATCLIDALGVGTCRLRCETPGAADPTCSSLASHACVGETGDGFCLPTTNLGQSETCTDGTTTPAVPFTCAAGFGCIHLDEHPAGLGVCLEDCTAAGDVTCETGSCFDLDTVVPGGGIRCLSELPRRTRGCDPIAVLCETGSFCVTLSDDDAICKQRCTIASCPGGSCECSGGETCIETFLASTETGVCGSVADLGEACDEDQDVYCEQAPGEDIEGNAISLCLADRCQVLCRYTDSTTGDPVDLACPNDMACRPDPTGRLLPSVRVCVDEP